MVFPARTGRSSSLRSLDRATVVGAERTNLQRSMRFRWSASHSRPALQAPPLGAIPEGDLAEWNDAPSGDAMRENALRESHLWVMDSRLPSSRPLQCHRTRLGCCVTRAIGHRVASNNNGKAVGCRREDLLPMRGNQRDASERKWSKSSASGVKRLVQCKWLAVTVTHFGDGEPSTAAGSSVPFQD
jgi:hypothetical protein